MKISKVMQQIRDLINDTHLYHQLVVQSDKWYVICSAMDVVEDCDMAVNTYLKSKMNKSGKNWFHNCGKLYLYIYGIMQALYIQQDAVHHLLEKLNLNIIWLEYSKQLDDIRQIRNDATGHPVLRNKKETSNFISRSDMSLSGFNLLIHSQKHNMKSEYVDLQKLIKLQKHIILACLKKTTLALRISVNQYRSKFVADKLSDLFKMKDWHFSKIYESKENSMSLVFGISALEYFKNSIDQFADKCLQRNCLDISELEHEFSDIKLLCERIYLELCNDDGKRDSLTLDSHIVNLKKKINHIDEIAKEIDTDFSSRV